MKLFGCINFAETIPYIFLKILFFFSPGFDRSSVLQIAESLVTGENISQDFSLLHVFQDFSNNICILYFR